jgi:hypothetical protein
MSTEEWRSLERSIVTTLLADDDAGSAAISDLERTLRQRPGLTIRSALGELQDAGVVTLDRERVTLSASVRRLEALGLIGL